MSTVEVKSGLRKLEFTAQDATVEFVRSSRLGSTQTVRVLLGRREGVIREIVGRPHLIRAVPLGRGKTEYHYRLQAPIVAEPF